MGRRSAVRTGRRAPAEPLGWAFVGLGTFAQYELLPGSLRSKYSRCVAVVTGHSGKVSLPNPKLGGKSIKDAFGLKDSDIYGYDNFDAIRDNKAVDVVHVVHPNGMHRESTVRAFPSRQACRRHGNPYQAARSAGLREAA